MTGVERRRRAAVLLIIASVLWWHRWVSALLVVGFVSWVILHRWLEGDLGEVLARGWQRAWPPRAVWLIPLVLGGTLAYGMSGEPTTPKVLPITLNMLELSIILLGGWWARLAHPERCWMAGKQTRSGPWG